MANGLEKPPTTFDIAIIGAGPAGLAAADVFARSNSASHGKPLSVVVIDLNPFTGGQFWKNSDSSVESSTWHHHWGTFRSLNSSMKELTHLYSTQVSRVQRIDNEFVLYLSGSIESPHRVVAKKVIYCGGTFDRQLPVEGWTLPGVMAAGGIQAFIKENGVAPGNEFVVAGTGPFLLAAAATIIRAGGKVHAIVDSSVPTAWFPRGAFAALVPSKIAEALEYMFVLTRHRVSFHFNSIVQRINANSAGDGVASVEIRSGNKTVTYKVDGVGLNWGFTPQLELLLQLGGETTLGLDGSLVAKVDKNFESSVPGFFVAGEGNGVTGVLGAVAEGRIAAHALLGKSAPRKEHLAVKRNNLFSTAFHKAGHIPKDYFEKLSGDTTFCRCEDVSWERVNDYLTHDASVDARSVKGTTRVGMGNCQGRMCGSALCLASDAARTRRALPEVDDSAARAAALHQDLRSIAAKPLATPETLESFADG